MGRGAWGVGLLLLGGCVGPRETQFLRCAPRSLNVEARSYEYHDPFADEAAGPSTFTRPRTFSEPRSDTRKQFELRNLQALHPNAGRTQFASGPQPLWRVPGATASATYNPSAVLPAAPSGAMANEAFTNGAVSWNGNNVLPY